MTREHLQQQEGQAEPKPLLFTRPDGGQLKITSRALGVMSSFIQNTPNKTEAGGVLLGRHVVGTDDIIVDRITQPLPGDRRSRFRFFRGRFQHQTLIDQAWAETGGTCTYLGEWHTHPEQYPAPSLFDRLGWQKKLKIDKFTDPLFFVIVGTEGVGVWEGQCHQPLQQLFQAKMQPKKD